MAKPELILGTTTGGLMLLKQGLRGVFQKRFIGEVELFVFGAPIFGEVLPVMCMIPTKRTLRTQKLPVLLYWDEVAGYGASGNVKRKRTLVTEYQAGKQKLVPGDVLRQEVALSLPATPPPDTLGKLGRTFYKVTLTLKLCIDIDRCPDVSEEFEIAVEPLLSNQKTILENQATLKDNQKTILEKQVTLKTLMENQHTILNNQKVILENQDKILSW